MLIFFIDDLRWATSLQFLLLNFYRARGGQLLDTWEFGAERLRLLPLLYLFQMGLLLFVEEVARELASSVWLEPSLQLYLTISQLAICIQSLTQINKPFKTTLIPALRKTFPIFSAYFFLQTSARDRCTESCLLILVQIWLCGWRLKRLDYWLSHYMWIFYYIF